ncbi:hypothetical protein CFP56_023299, partial [Quercus suber]
PPQLLHFCDSKHPLVFILDFRGGNTCCGCQESIYGPTYYSREGGLQHWIDTTHHKSCAEVPLGLHHPLHPIHPLILFDEKTRYPEQEEEHKQKTKCQLCNESRRQYTYRCYCCDFNLHATCAFLPPTIESSQVHHHPLTPFWKWMSFTCDLGAKEVKGIPNLCALCSYCVHNTYASLPCTLKVLVHKHPLWLIHSSLEVELHQSNSRFCQLCAQKVNTNFGFYYCSKMRFCCPSRNRENIDLQKLKEAKNENSKLDQSAAYKVKNIKVGADGTEIATEIQHFSHEHDLKLSDDEVLNIEKCDGCVQAIFPPFYTSFYMNLVLNYLQKNDTHFINTYSPSSQSHDHPVGVKAMDSTIRVRNACILGLVSMFHTSLPTLAMSIHFFFLALHLNITTMNETQNIGSIIVQIAVILHIPNVFLAKTQMSSDIYNGYLPGGSYTFVCQYVTYTPLISWRKSKATLNCYCYGFNYKCETCYFIIDVPCSLKLDILTHHGHEHRLLLPSIESKQNCSCCDSKIYPIFRCTTCEFALDFNCATLPLTVRYNQHEHPFTLCYTDEDDSGEYYCDICEEEHNPKYWFYCYLNCEYPVFAHLSITHTPLLSLRKSKITLNNALKRAQKKVNFVEESDNNIKNNVVDSYLAMHHSSILMARIYPSQCCHNEKQEVVDG